MSEQEPPKIEFPCEYPIKVLGDAAVDFEIFVVEVMSKHAGTIAASQVSVRASRNATFQAVTVTITATGIEQLQAINNELQASSRVKMVI